MVDTATFPERKGKSISSSSYVSQEEAESILGFKFFEFYESQQSIEQFITKTVPEQLKKERFKRLNDCIVSQGLPKATISSLNESVVTDYRWNNFDNDGG